MLAIRRSAIANSSGAEATRQTFRRNLHPDGSAHTTAADVGRNACWRDLLDNSADSVARTGRTAAAIGAAAGADRRAAAHGRLHDEECSCIQTKSRPPRR